MKKRMVKIEKILISLDIEGEKAEVEADYSDLKLNGLGLRGEFAVDLAPFWKKSSEDWCGSFGITKDDIIDADGWDRKDFDRSWAESITCDEFVRRLSESTLKGGAAKKVAKQTKRI